MLKLFVADVLTQVIWQTVPYTRSCSTEASVAETVVFRRIHWQYQGVTSRRCGLCQTTLDSVVNSRKTVVTDSVPI